MRSAAAVRFHRRPMFRETKNGLIRRSTWGRFAASPTIS